MNLIPNGFLDTNSGLIRKLFREVFSAYLEASKQAILEYILRSPDERKRLHILVLPKKALTAAGHKFLQGGYSQSLYSGTHFRHQAATESLKLRLLTHNIVLSTLQSWFYEFRNFMLFDMQSFDQILRLHHKQQVEDVK